MRKDGGGCHRRLRDTPTLGELCMTLLRMSVHELNVSLYLLRKFKFSPGSKLPASPNDASPPVLVVLQSSRFLTQNVYRQAELPEQHLGNHAAKHGCRELRRNVIGWEGIQN